MMVDVIIARKLLFTVGAHEGLKSGSESGRMREIMAWGISR
jgi:hypothetical protein